MKIAIDSQPILKNKTGVGYYTYHIIKALESIDFKNDYKLVIWKFFLDTSNLNHLRTANFKFKFIHFPIRVYTKLFKLGIKVPLNLFLKAPDIFFFSNFVRWPIFKSKSIIVIYDLSYLKFPQYGEQKNVKFLTKNMPRSIEKSKHIITISENSKKEIIENYKVNPGKITIIYPSFDQELFQKSPQEKIQKVKQRYNIKGKYLLFTSTLEPRKNVSGIVKAYSLLPSSIKDEYCLVLAGGKGWQDENLLETIKEAQKEGLKIIKTGYVPEEDLPSLYSGASLFLYPSFYEGFGIPILEAMACEVPVITSNTSSMPEVAGDAAILVDPKDTNEIKEAILKVLNNPDLKKQMIENGMSQIKKFAWVKSARKLVEVFEKVNQNK